MCLQWCLTVFACRVHGRKVFTSKRMKIILFASLFAPVCLFENGQDVFAVSPEKWRQSCLLLLACLLGEEKYEVSRKWSLFVIVCVRGKVWKEGCLHSYLLIVCLFVWRECEENLHSKLFVENDGTLFAIVCLFVWRHRGKTLFTRGKLFANIFVYRGENITCLLFTHEKLFANICLQINYYLFIVYWWKMVS